MSRQSDLWSKQYLEGFYCAVMGGGHNVYTNQENDLYERRWDEGYNAGKARVRHIIQATVDTFKGSTTPSPMSDMETGA